ncbi:MAG: 50S ribosomal protein L17 [Patescibacteria group bacterium]|nr:50S ribosomal protein L17 [Patescibacteria group bacterium]
MKHRVKKQKFNFGKDSNKMLLKKLIINFLKVGYIETTLTKAKFLKSHLERIIYKGKNFNESNKNYLLKYLSNYKLVKKIFDEIAPSFSNFSGGYVRIIKKNLKSGDGSLIARLEWSHPIIKKEKNIANKDKKIKSNKKVNLNEENEKNNSTNKID